MKKFLIFFIFLVVWSVYSCGDDKPSYYSHDEVGEKYSEVFCDKVFNCKEGEPARLIYGGNENSCIDISNKEQGNEEECDGYDGNKAADCINCLDELSCEDFFSEKNKNMGKCPVCKEVCPNKSGE